MQRLSLWTLKIKLYKVIKIISPISKALYNIWKKAINQGFNLKVDIKILASYIKILLEKHNSVIAKVT